MGADPLELARFTLELEERLALFFVLGPPDRAVEVLRFVRAHLPKERPTAWHRLDRDGLDLEAAAQAAGEGAIVLVHGLERLTDEDQLWAVSLINLHRDRLGRVRGALVLFVPEGEVARFVQRAPDLWSWRTQVLEIGADQVPLPESEARRRRFLLAQFRSLDFIEPPSWWMRADRGRMTQRAFFIEPEILGPTGETMLLSRWAEGLRRGLITGPAGSGRRTALKWLAWRAAERALEDPEAPVPLVLGAGDRDLLVEQKGGDLAVLLMALSHRLGLTEMLRSKDARFGLYVARYSAFSEGSRPLLSALDERSTSWGLATVLTTGLATEGRAGWMPGGLQPWDEARVERWADAAGRARAPQPRMGWELEHQALLASWHLYEKITELIAYSPSLRALCADLPSWTLVGGDAFAWELSRALERHGLVNESWFALLRQTQPRRSEEVDALEAERSDPIRQEWARFEEPAPSKLPRLEADPARERLTPLRARPQILAWGTRALAWRSEAPVAERMQELSTRMASRGQVRDLMATMGLTQLLGTLSLTLKLEEEHLVLQSPGKDYVLRAPSGNGAAFEITRLQREILIAHAFLEPEADTIRFPFPILQDWYAAQALAAMPPARRDPLLSEHAQDPAWAQLLEFYTWILAHD